MESMMAGEHRIVGTVEVFPQKGGWHYVRVPEVYTALTRNLADRGLVPITVTAGPVTWDTSFLPMGDGTHFVALPARVRQANAIAAGDAIELSFMLRER